MAKLVIEVPEELRGLGEAFSPATARWSASASATIPRNSPWKHPPVVAHGWRAALSHVTAVAHLCRRRRQQRQPAPRVETAPATPRERDHPPDYGLSLSARDKQVEQD